MSPFFIIFSQAIVYFVIEHPPCKGGGLAPLDVTRPRPRSCPRDPRPLGPQLQTPPHGAAGLRQAARRKGCHVEASRVAGPFCRHSTRSAFCLQYRSWLSPLARKRRDWTPQPSSSWLALCDAPWDLMRPRLPSGLPPMSPQNLSRNTWQVSCSSGADGP